MEVRIKWKRVEGGARVDYTAESTNVFFSVEEVQQYGITRWVETLPDGNRLTVDPMILRIDGCHEVATLIDTEVLRQEHAKDKALGIHSVGEDD